MDSKRFRLRKLVPPETLVLAVVLLPILGALVRHAVAQGAVSLSAPFERRVLAAALPEAPFHLRFFTTAVKTGSDGKIITGPTDDPVKNLVGAESAGERAGMERYTKIMFGAAYLDGRPDPGTRIDPNSPEVKSGSQYWPFVKQPFRSWPNALAVTPDGRKLYVTLPGRATPTAPACTSPTVSRTRCAPSASIPARTSRRSPRFPRPATTSTAPTRATSTSRPTAAPSTWPTPWGTLSP